MCVSVCVCVYVCVCVTAGVCVVLSFWLPQITHLFSTAFARRASMILFASSAAESLRVALEVLDAGV